MNKSSDFAQNLLDQASSSQDANTTAVLLTAMKTLAEGEKFQAEAVKLEREADNIERLKRSDNRRFTITVLAPSISAMAVVLALAVQVYQINENMVLQRETNDATNLREDLKLAASSNGNQAFAGSLALTSMLRSPTYGNAARAIAINVLTHSAEVKSFGIIFDEILNYTNWDNIRDLVRLSADLTSGLVDARGRVDDKNAGRPAKPSMVNLDPEIIAAALNDEVDIVAHGIIRYFRTHSRASVLAVDLDGINFSNQDLNGLNLSKAKIPNAILNQATVVGANLSDVIEFEGSEWSAVEWWKARFMSRSLLDYLKKQYPFSADVSYTKASGSMATDSAFYAHELARLEK
jgi:hypothetical protein